jgi:hypothetical protein
LQLSIIVHPSPIPRPCTPLTNNSPRPSPSTLIPSLPRFGAAQLGAACAIPESAFGNLAKALDVEASTALNTAQEADTTTSIGQPSSLATETPTTTPDEGTYVGSGTRSLLLHTWMLMM